MRSPGTTRRGCLRSALKRNAQLMILSIAHLPNRRHARYFFLQKNRQTSRESAEAGMVVVTRAKGGLGGRYTGVFSATCLNSTGHIYTRINPADQSSGESCPHAHADFHGIIPPPPPSP